MSVIFFHTLNYCYFSNKCALFQTLFFTFFLLKYGTPTYVNYFFTVESPSVTSNLLLPFALMSLGSQILKPSLGWLGEE